MGRTDVSLTWQEFTNFFVREGVGQVFLNLSDLERDVHEAFLLPLPNDLMTRSQLEANLFENKPLL